MCETAFSKSSIINRVPACCSSDSHIQQLSAQVYLNLAARRSATESWDAAKAGAADARVAQHHAQPQHTAKNTAKRKRAEESAALSDADAGRPVAVATADSAVREQSGDDGAGRLEGNDSAAPAEPDADVAVRKEELDLVEDDVDWTGEAATE